MCTSIIPCHFTDLQFKLYSIFVWRQVKTIDGGSKDQCEYVDGIVFHKVSLGLYELLPSFSLFVDFGFNAYII